MKTKEIYIIPDTPAGYKGFTIKQLENLKNSIKKVNLWLLEDFCEFYFKNKKIAKNLKEKGFLIYKKKKYYIDFRDLTNVKIYFINL